MPRNATALRHGAVLESIVAQCDGYAGESLTAGIATARLRRVASQRRVFARYADRESGALDGPTFERLMADLHFGGDDDDAFDEPHPPPPQPSADGGGSAPLERRRLRRCGGLRLASVSFCTRYAVYQKLSRSPAAPVSGTHWRHLAALLPIVALLQLVPVLGGLTLPSLAAHA